jgi:hypothetical protein
MEYLYYICLLNKSIGFYYLIWYQYDTTIKMVHAIGYQSKHTYNDDEKLLLWI